MAHAVYIHYQQAWLLTLFCAEESSSRLASQLLKLMQITAKHVTRTCNIVFAWGYAHSVKCCQTSIDSLNRFNSVLENDRSHHKTLTKLIKLNFCKCWDTGTFSQNVKRRHLSSVWMPSLARCIPKISNRVICRFPWWFSYDLTSRKTYNRW